MLLNVFCPASLRILQSSIVVVLLLESIPNLDLMYYLCLLFYVQVHEDVQSWSNLPLAQKCSAAAKLGFYASNLKNKTKHMYYWFFKLL